MHIAIAFTLTVSLTVTAAEFADASPAAAGQPAETHTAAASHPGASTPLVDVPGRGATDDVLAHLRDGAKPDRADPPFMGPADTPWTTREWAAPLQSHPHRSADQPTSDSHSGDELEMPHHAAVVSACESGRRLPDGTAELGTHDWGAVNQQGSSASGAFQFVDSTWEWVAGEIGADAYPRAKNAPPETQLEGFLWLWQHGGPVHWAPSRSCWSLML